MRKQFILAFLAAFLVAFGLLALGGALERANAQETPKTFAVYGGVNGIWFDNQSEPADLELGGTLRASLSPHLAGIGSLYYGVDKSYLRSTVGARVTATDVNNRDFSIGFGAAYQSATEPDVRPEEWISEVSLGWRPWPETMPKLVLGAQGQYGLKSNEAAVLLAARWKLTEF